MPQEMFPYNNDELRMYKVQLLTLLEEYRYLNSQLEMEALDIDPLHNSYFTQLGTELRESYEFGVSLCTQVLNEGINRIGRVIQELVGTVRAIDVTLETREAQEIQG